ncbi:unnamed protein product [Bursaphelenchus xylophilus]|uniref:(pine wood nematode) hypothetical protein n=1 Tax=Bursaphelenchus xylophilus TaxID=6326 RepID=A0A1I7RW83_BURXY|nr:unnamed protein product [Bursaphelenchus xylophilus]CAG9095259.1 unnamed protein product [Bursaphelenchus xylophilus]
MSKEGLLPAERLRGRINLRNKFHAALVAELFGTFLLVFLVVGISCQHVLTDSKLVSFLSINIGVGFIVALCVYATYTTSGGQLNPAVSITLVFLGHITVPQFFAYVAVQTVGAFFGAAAGFAVYQDALHHYAGTLRTITGPNATAGIFCSFPAAHISNCGAFVDQVAGTALLLFFVCVFTDKRNNVPAFLHPLCFGFALMLIGFTYGMNLGYPVNPARDFGPRLFAVFAGYGWEVFSYHDYYFWIPIVAPLIGGPLGAFLYHLFIGAHAPDSVQEVKKISLQKNGDETEPLANSA